MKKYILIVASFVLVVISTGCKENKKTSVESESNQMELVMDLHDEAMENMPKMGRLIAQLRKKIDNDQGGVAEKKAMEDLQDANKSMMDWMQGFMKRFDSDEIMNGQTLTEEKQQWLNEEEEKVNIVKEKIDSSIANAEALLAQ